MIYIIQDIQDIYLTGWKAKLLKRQPRGGVYLRQASRAGVLVGSSGA